MKRDGTCSDAPVEDSGQRDAPAMRWLGGEHAAMVHKLENACFSSPWGLKQITAALAMKQFSFIGLFLGQRLVGYVSMYHSAPEMEILNLAVLKEYRKQGFGRRLLESVLKTARKMGIVKIFLEVRTSNTPARNLYDSAGFTLVGRRRNYYPDNGEDALVMALELDGAEIGRDAGDTENKEPR